MSWLTPLWQNDLLETQIKLKIQFTVRASYVAWCHPAAENTIAVVRIYFIKYQHYSYTTYTLRVKKANQYCMYNILLVW